jgi:DNA-directed RNA polymerase specialized sigma24 family protein
MEQKDKVNVCASFFHKKLQGVQPMPFSTRIAPYLPMLRRYARAMTGSQTAGDAHVAAILKKLAEDISCFPEASNDRIALYKLLCSHFGSITLDPDSENASFAWERRAAEHLARLPEQPRQAFLLSALEGLKLREIAEVFQTDEAGARNLLGQAGREVSRQIATNVMIIEDEPLIAMDIRRTVEELGHSVVGIARTHDEAHALFMRNIPNFVLADIQLADGSSGMDAVDDILRKKHVPVIFITAFPEKLLTGNAPEPAFLLTKPFDTDMLKALISQILLFQPSKAEIS